MPSVSTVNGGRDFVVPAGSQHCNIHPRALMNVGSKKSLKVKGSFDFQKSSLSACLSRISGRSQSGFCNATLSPAYGSI